MGVLQNYYNTWAYLFEGADVMFSKRDLKGNVLDQRVPVFPLGKVSIICLDLYGVDFVINFFHNFYVNKIVFKRKQQCQQRLRACNLFLGNNPSEIEILK